MATRVRLSIISTTWRPSSRNHSAIRVATMAARNRSTGGASEVATTTTERARPSGPRSFSMNSRTSRPRSPTSAITETSASVPRAIIDNRLDLPTPEPAMMPIRWPRPHGVSASRARTPSPSWSWIRGRLNACGDAWSTGTLGRAASDGPSSTGRPRPSRTRPRSASPTRIRSGPPVWLTTSPTRRPAVSPRGRQVTPVGPLAATSASTVPERVPAPRRRPGRRRRPRARRRAGAGRAAR